MLWSTLFAAVRIHTGNLQFLSKYGAVAKLLQILQVTADDVVAGLFVWCFHIRESELSLFHIKIHVFSFNFVNFIILGKVIQLIEAIALHNITVKDLRSLLSEMRIQQSSLNVSKFYQFDCQLH